MLNRSLLICAITCFFLAALSVTLLAKAPPSKAGSLKICSTKVPAALLQQVSNARKTAVGSQQFQPELAVLQAYLWPPNERDLRISFVGGGSGIRQRVITSANKWLAEAKLPIKFIFGDYQDAQIRISFDSKTGSWSYVGTQAKYIKAPQPTMNFGWLTPATPDEEYDRVVLHEFGHALGAIHEHQSPTGTICWNKELVYSYFARTNKWSHATVDQQIFALYEPSEIAATPIDRTSIMMYFFPAELTCDGTGMPSNTSLSAHDVSFMQKLYGAPQLVRPRSR